MKTHVLLIDNFDSFVYNLYQYLGEVSQQVTVVRSTAIPIKAIERGMFSHIVISPGPGNPTEPAYFGACQAVIQRFYTKYPVLGVCLGHQGIGAAFGARIMRAPSILHGKTSTFEHSGEGILRDLPPEITVMRYHSLAIDPASVPDELVIDARADDGTVMAFHHRDYPTYGLQFHPESFGTPTGKTIISNFLEPRHQL
jgi:anthranilate synthase component II